MNQAWSWILTAVGVFGLYLAGRRSLWGWAIGLGSQVLWLAYSITTRQWGFLVSCFAYGGIHSLNLWRAMREPKPIPLGPPGPPVPQSEEVPTCCRHDQCAAS